jgi:uncharacterized delta-60 repeat protein
MKRFLFSALGLAALLAACQTPMPSLEEKPVGVAGQVELTFDLGQKRASAVFYRRGLSLQAVQTNLSFSNNPTMNVLSDVLNSQNYISATFDVSNLTGSSLTDLTLVAKHQQGNHPGTAVKNAVNFSGGSLDLNLFATNVKPTLMPTTLSPFTVNSNVADVQFLTELETATLQSQAVNAAQVNTANGEYLLPYGFVARSNTSRTLPTGAAAGTLTVSIKLPSGNEPSSNVTRFSMTFVAFDQPVGSRVSEAFEEQSNSSAISRATSLGAARVAALQNSALHLETAGTQVNVCQVRTAGTAAVPIAKLENSVLPSTSGDFDPCFGAQGKRSFNSSTNLSDKVVAYAVLSDGSILVAGERNTTNSDIDAMILKYLPDGSLDPSFGVNGVAIANSTTNDQIVGFQLLPDGKMLLIGAFQYTVFKFLANGTLDTTFGTNGIKTTVLSVAGQNDITSKSVIGSSGEIYLVGASKPTSATNYDFAVVVYTSTGGVYSSFNGGTFTYDLSVGSDDIPLHAFLAPDETLYIVGESASGTTNQNYATIKFTTGGQLDPNYAGIAGFQVVDSGLNDVMSDAKLLSDGSVLMAGNSLDSAGNERPLMIKLDAFGMPDNGFGSLGIYHPAASTIQRAFKSFLVLSSGSILATGYGTSASASDLAFTLTKLDSSGFLDNTFGTNGQSITNIFSGNDVPDNIVLDGTSIIVSGVGIIPGSGFLNPAKRYMTLVKYSASGVLDTTFDGDGIKTSLFGNNGSSLGSTLKPHVFANHAILHMAWMGYSSGSNNIVMYKTLP